jgi:thymidine phosphorylase
MDGTALGRIVVALGGGRQREDDQIDHSVGLSEITPLGAKLRRGQLMVLVHCHDTEHADNAMLSVQAAITVGATEPAPKPLILERIIR